MGKIIMGYWDCKFCNKTRIAGSDRDCPSCGHPRPDGTRFYMDGTKPVDENTAQIVRARGRDWTCPACDCLNSGLDNTCIGCGAPRNATISNTERKESPSKNIDISSIDDILIDMRQTTEQMCSISKPHKSHTEAVNKKKLLLTIGGILAGIALIVGLIILFIPKPATIKISKMGWEYNIDIEKLTTVNESDWYLPSGARLHYTQEEIHHYDPVLDHYEPVEIQVPDGYDEKVVGYRDLGNGYFEEITEREPRYRTEMSQSAVYRQEPRYQTKYYYEIDKWLHNRTITTSAFDKKPEWGKVTLHTNEREGSRKETYTIYGTDTENKSRTVTVTRTVWENYNIGDTVSGRVDIFGHFTPDTN